MRARKTPAKAGAKLGVASVIRADRTTRSPRPQANRPVFVIELRAEPGIEPLMALRAALRRLIRDHGLKCVRLSRKGG